jgi:hypothetical protein
VRGCGAPARGRHRCKAGSVSRCIAYTIMPQTGQQSSQPSACSHALAESPRRISPQRHRGHGEQAQMKTGVSKEG